MPPTEHEPTSLEKMKEKKAGWPETKGLKIGERIRLPDHTGLTGGEIVGVEEILDQRGPIVYATVRIDNRPNVRPQIEVGELKTLQKDLELMDRIADELETIHNGEEELAIVVKRIEDLIKKLNTNKDAADDSYGASYVVEIILQNKKYGRLTIDKNHSGAYRVRLEKNEST